MTQPTRLTHQQHGFTLVEIAIVLLIVALLMGGLLPTLSSQIEQRRNSDTSKQLEDIKDALIGFAIINGRLPCPAFGSGNSLESFASGGNASNGNCLNSPSSFYNGFVPAATLGLSGTMDSSGYLLDSWGNRIHYAVTAANSKAFTTTGIPLSTGMQGVGISNLAPDLLVCSTASTSSSSCSATNSYLTATPGVPVVIYSTGRNGGYGGTGADEVENPNPHSSDNDRVFISHIPTSSGAPNGEFDDIVTWISQTVLINRMVAAGKLP
jgi:prepilin-type N-terminal cleavage/methylation domain-containing protein